MTAVAADTATPMLLSRVAESAYWAGRYLERAEGTARVVNAHGDLLLDLPAASGVRWSSLLAIVGAEVSSAVTEDEVVKYLAADADNGSSIVSSVSALHHNLRVTRTIIPIEAAEVLTELHLLVGATAHEAVDRASRRRWLTQVIRYCQTLSGILVDTMSRDDAYGFFTIGRQLERADFTSRVLDVQANVLSGRANEQVAPWAGICWAAALRSLSALQAFRRRGIAPSGDATVAFLLDDPNCPRAIGACLDEIARWIAQLPRNGAAVDAWDVAQTMLDDADVSELIDGGGLHDFVDEVQAALGDIHNALYETWFAATDAELVTP